MNAAQALDQAANVGLQVVVDGRDLLLEAIEPPPMEVVEALRNHKTAIVELLRGAAAWSPGDWQAYFDERAAIAEYDGGVERDDAERLAAAECIAHWQRLNPPIARGGDLCPGCGSSVDDARHRVCYLAGQRAVRLHAECASDWENGRQQSALVALQKIGLKLPANTHTVPLPDRHSDSSRAIPDDPPRAPGGSAHRSKSMPTSS